MAESVATSWVWPAGLGRAASDLAVASRIEALKLRRSRLPLATVLAFTLVSLVGALFMFILQNPARARAWGLLGAKAQLTVGTADAPGYFAFLGEATAVGALIVFGFVFVWIFGREFADDTAKDLLALPVPRTAIVTAKALVAAVWCMVLAIWTYLLGLVAVAALGLPGASGATFGHALVRMLLIAAMMVALVTPFGLVATIGRGYLAATGIMFLTVFVTQIIGVLGYGHVFPWAVPAMYAGAAGSRATPPGWIGYLLVALVGVAGVWATGRWWRAHDQA
jgi:ABC-2 type transport system permease protein